jgi:hypothetical protein
VGGWVGWGGPGLHVVTPTRVEVELGGDNDKIQRGRGADNLVTILRAGGRQVA